jgi:GTP-binding protein
MQNIKKSKFIKSSSTLESCPGPVYPEYAFIGRSNVGKSSLLNMLTNIRNLAKTSGTPGKTKLINHFLINDEWYMVDLPGYGYMETGKRKIKDIIILITDYILNRENLICLFILLDCRHDPQIIDLEFIKWIGINGIPFVLCFTKADKISKSQLDKRIKNYKKILLDSWQTLPEIFITSSVNKTGREEILNFILNTNSSVNI